MHPLQLPDFSCHDLGEGLAFHVGKLPVSLLVDDAQFELLWALHPPEFHRIHMPGGPVATPRWQQAFGKDYHYTGNVNKALPIPDILRPIHRWACEHIYPDLNAILVNWYDGTKGHYIGKHRDSTVHMIPSAPIVTISFGEQRTFRLRPWKGKGYRDFLTAPGSVFVMPYELNLRWTHEVPPNAKCLGRRISITIRAFEESAQTSG